MELIDLSPIKPMLMRALANSEAIKTFINFHLWLLGSFGLLLLHIFIICSLWYIAYLLREHKVRENKNKQERKTIIKNAISEYLRKVKRPLRKLRYLIIWFMLIFCAWLFVSMIFYIYRWSRWYNCSFSPEENQILGYWSFLSLIIFLIAPLFIMFCFGNKFIRNIWILIYIFWIWFIAMWKFISIGCAWMENEEELKETEEIENVKELKNVWEVEDIKEIETFWGLKTLELD